MIETIPGNPTLWAIAAIGLLIIIGPPKIAQLSVYAVMVAIMGAFISGYNSLEFIAITATLTLLGLGRAIAYGGGATLNRSTSFLSNLVTCYQKHRENRNQGRGRRQQPVNNPLNTGHAAVAQPGHRQQPGQNEIPQITAGNIPDHIAGWTREPDTIPGLTTWVQTDPLLTQHTHRVILRNEPGEHIVSYRSDNQARDRPGQTILLGRYSDQHDAIQRAIQFMEDHPTAETIDPRNIVSEIDPNIHAA